MIVYIRTDWRKYDSPQGSHNEIGGGIQIPETKLQALLPFPTPPPERPRELAVYLETFQVP